LDFPAPIIMEYPRRRAEVDQAVEQLPTAAAEPSDPLSCGSDCQGNERNKAEEARNDKRAFQEHVLKHCTEIEVLIQPDIRSQMHEAIKECKESEHPSETDKATPSDETPKRGYGQGDHQKT